MFRIEISDYLKYPITSLRFQPSEKVTAFPKQFFEDIDSLWKSSIDGFDYWSGMLDYWESILLPLISRLDMIIRKDSNTFLRIIQILSKFDFFKVCGDFYRLDIYNLLLNLPPDHSSMILEDINGISPQKVMCLQEALKTKNGDSFRTILEQTRYSSIIDECRVLLRIGTWQNCIKYSVSRYYEYNAVVGFFFMIGRFNNLFSVEYIDHRRAFDGMAHNLCLSLNKTKQKFNRDDFCTLFGAFGKYCYLFILCIYLLETSNWPIEKKSEYDKLFQKTFSAREIFEKIWKGFYRRETTKQRKEYLHEVLDSHGKDLFQRICSDQRIEIESQQDTKPDFITQEPKANIRRRQASLLYPWNLIPSTNIARKILPMDEILNALPNKTSFWGIDEKKSDETLAQYIENDSPIILKGTDNSTQDNCSTKKTGSVWPLPTDFFDVTYEGNYDIKVFFPGFLNHIISIGQGFDDPQKMKERIELCDVFCRFVNDLAQKGYIDNDKDTKLAFTRALTGRRVKTKVEKVEWKRPNVLSSKQNDWLNDICYLVQQLYPKYICDTNKKRMSKFRHIFTVFGGLGDWKKIESSYANNVGEDFKALIDSFIDTVRKIFCCF